MSYSPHNIIKRKAREFAKSQGIPLSKALEQQAVQNGFAHYYELAQVAKRYPSDPRLIFGAFGTNDLKKAVDEVDLTDRLQDLADEAFAGAVADTNAYDFIVEDVEVSQATYDPSTGMLELDIAFQYSGDQDPDRPWHGNIFYVNDAKVRFYWRDERWQLAYDDEFEVLQVDTDRDRDYEQQRADGLI